jgi:two-component system sensor histidine kinase HydH
VRLADLLREIGRKASGISRAGDRTPVEVRCAEDVEVRTDRVLLGRLLQNLVLNALDASPEGQAVLLEAAAVANGEVSIAVLDTGRGMPRAELADLLRFGRSGSSGTGIGSASAEDCARSLGSVLEVRTRLGRGTEVRFRIRSLEPAG